MVPKSPNLVPKSQILPLWSFFEEGPKFQILYYSACWWCSCLPPPLQLTSPPRLGIGNLLGNPGNGQVHHRLDAVDHVFHPFFYLGQRQTWTSHWSGKLPWKLGKRRLPRHHHRTEHLVHQSWRQSRINITENL